MRVALMIEPHQGLSYEEQLSIARRAEALGYDALLRSDHYQSFPGDSGRASSDAWIVVAGLARETQRIRLGVLVSPVTFRHPGSFAKVVATVDHMSGGRIDVGVGAGWNEGEHRQLGLAFPDIKERGEREEEELQILHGLWDEPDGWSFHGRYYSLEGAAFHPRPVQQPHPPIIVGAEGSPRSIRIAARYADEYNMSSATAETCRDAFERLDRECERIGRDPSEVARSVMVGVLIGEDEATFRRRVEDQVAFLGLPPEEGRAYLEQRRPRWLMGSPAEARERAAALAAAGAQRLVLQDLLPRDGEMIELAGREIVGRV